MDLEATFGTPKPVVGMVHLPPLPGSPRAGADAEIKPVVGQALADARALEAGGVDGLLVENFGDAPYYPDDVPKHTVAAMTRVATAITEETDPPLGVNVLRNDATAALSIAAAVGGAFVRVNVHSGARAADQGILEGRAHDTLRLRERLGRGFNPEDAEDAEDAEDQDDDDDGDGASDDAECSEVEAAGVEGAGPGVAIWADVDVKHSAPLAGGSVRRSVANTVERGLADAVVVSGPATGEGVEPSALQAALGAREEFGLEVPVIVGSGVEPETVADQLADADGVIVGTALKEGGETTAPVDQSRVEALVERADEPR